MVKSSWVYQRLRRFRCGIEGVISFFETSLWSRPMHMALIAFFEIVRMEFHHHLQPTDDGKTPITITLLLFRPL